MTSAAATTIRPYQTADYAAVVELNSYGLAAAGVSQEADVYSGDLENLNATYATDRAILLVAEVNGSVIAMGALRPVSDSTCEITRMRVAPAAQGRGIGKAILAALEDHARSLGYACAVLLTGPNQHPAIDLYRAAGYEIVATEHHGKLIGVRMRKGLTRSP